VSWGVLETENIGPEETKHISLEQIGAMEYAWINDFDIRLETKHRICESEKLVLKFAT
jgi:hypothetical protein